MGSSLLYLPHLNPVILQKSSPSMTELEEAMLDWLVGALGLPETFRNSHPGPGCGIIQVCLTLFVVWKNSFFQNSASEATLLACIAARARAVENIKNGDWKLGSEVSYRNSCVASDFT